MGISDEEEDTSNSLAFEILEFLKCNVLSFLSHIYLSKNIDNNSDYLEVPMSCESLSNSYRTITWKIRFSTTLQNKT